MFVCFVYLWGLLIYIYNIEGGSNLKGTLMFPFLGDDNRAKFAGVFCSIDLGHVFVVTIHSLLLVGGGNSNIFSYFHPQNWED